MAAESSGLDEVESCTNDRHAVYSEIPVEVIDVSDLAETVDTETGDRYGTDRAEERESVGMSVEHGHERRGPLLREESREDVRRGLTESLTSPKSPEDEVR